MLLELVNSDGAGIGTTEKLAAHQPPGQLHRAFSVFLFSADGRMLLQQRASHKYHSPGVWSNACCGHPGPTEAPMLAAVRRTIEELGCCPTLICEAGTVTYQLTDTASGLVEHEYNHVFIGIAPTELAPDPAEVENTRLVDLPELDELIEGGGMSVWFPTVWAVAAPLIGTLGVAVDAGQWANS